MRIRRRRIKDQTIVITGASSGIGLATARLAATRGARVLLTSRNEQDLRGAVADIIAGAALGFALLQRSGAGPARNAP